MDKTITAEILATMQALPRLKWQDLFAAKDAKADPANLAKLAVIDVYLSKFLNPASETNPCICCGAPQTGIMGLLMGIGFRWGIVHGEGACTGCGWPARVYHFINAADGSLLLQFDLLLQYHPAAVEIRKRGQHGRT